MLPRQSHGFFHCAGCGVDETKEDHSDGEEVLFGEIRVR